jgi:HrpA-like RNA helicase
VILATDIAESSLTINGVRCVIDAGLARKPAHDAASGLTRLATAPISRASAEQRQGRAGANFCVPCASVFCLKVDGMLSMSSLCS